MLDYKNLFEEYYVIMWLASAILKSLIGFFQTYEYEYDSYMTSP